MAFLLRVELPDVPGSLGGLATALGGAGADIEAIEIVEHRSDGKAVDDVLLQLPPTVMPDELITACQAIEGVSVHWISRYNAGVNLSMDLEAIETFTEDPGRTVERMIEVMPATFRTDWAMALRGVDGQPAIVHGSPSAPEALPHETDWLAIADATTLDEVPEWSQTVLAATPGKDRAGETFVVVLGRHGGPEFLASELARLGHMVSLAATVQAV